MKLRSTYANEQGAAGAAAICTAFSQITTGKLTKKMFFDIESLKDMPESSIGLTRVREVQTTVVAAERLGNQSTEYIRNVHWCVSGGLHTATTLD